MRCDTELHTIQKGNWRKSCAETKTIAFYVLIYYWSCFCFVIITIIIFFSFFKFHLPRAWLRTKVSSFCVFFKIKTMWSQNTKTTMPMNNDSSELKRSIECNSAFSMAECEYGLKRDVLFCVRYRNKYNL